MSDKQCRYSHVRIIESNDARIVVHWRYAPVDVKYEHPFVDQESGWFDWVDEYYTIYPNATGVRAITVRSSGLKKWIEFQEGIVVNQPGTKPDQNIEKGAVSVANMQGQHKTYYWDRNGAPAFDENPPKANICRVNLKSERKPFALVAPPKKKNDLITSYGGHGRRSMFNWWDHWPVSQDALDGRGARSAARPSHSSLFHIALQRDPPVDCWGSYGYETVIRKGALEWTSTEWSGLNLMLGEPRDLSGSATISFDYAGLWSSDVTAIFYDKDGGATEEIALSEGENKLVLNNPSFTSFEKKMRLADCAGDVDISEITEVYFEVSGSEAPRTWKLDNIRIRSDASAPRALNYVLDFSMPDGSSIEEINVAERAEWAPHAEGKNTITKLMLHGMTRKNVQDLVPLARSWTMPAKLVLRGNGFKSLGYDPAQMAYVIERGASSDHSLSLEIEASQDSPLVHPAFVIKNWSNEAIRLTLNGKAMKDGEDYRHSVERRLERSDLIIWINKTQNRPASFKISSS